MRKAISTVVQLVFFYLVCLAGSLADPFHLRWFVKHPTLITTTYFVPDGYLLMAALFLLFLIVAAILKKLTSTASMTTLAFVVALVLSLVSKFGFASHDLF